MYAYIIARLQFFYEKHIYACQGSRKGAPVYKEGYHDYLTKTTTKYPTVRGLDKRDVAHRARTSMEGVWKGKNTPPKTMREILQAETNKYIRGY